MYKRKRAGNTITRKINSTKDTAAKADKNHYISNSYLEGFIPIDTEYFTASNRIEVTNSGTPLVDVRRIIDNPPKSRNEKLAALMRRLKMCEELGTGWDKIVITCELYQLPAPKIELFEDSTRVTLFSEIPFSNLSMENKLWACYLHACIKHVQGEQLTNSSLRERFGLENSASATISRLIKEAVAMEIIKPLDPTTAPRYMKYIPVWA